MKSSLQRRGS